MISLHLPVAHYRFSLQADSPVQLPAYAGSAWRGLFGNALKRSVCVTHEPDCRKCLLWRQCVYSYVFETPPPDRPDTILRHSSAVPHPFVIRPLATSGAKFATGDLMTVELVLVGRGNQHLPYIVHAFNVMGQTGIGKPDGYFHIAQLSRADAEGGWQPVYNGQGSLTAQAPELLRFAEPELCERVRLRFVTPYRSLQQGRLVQGGDFSARQFLGTLLRRVSMLQAFHTEQPLEADFKALSGLMETVQVAENGLRWHDWARYSSRQKTLIKMGGLLGEVELRGEALAVFLPLLQAGEQVHVGKAAVMGLGEYRLDVI
ncbi:MAG: CRISPR system precrRNA processing endoribonuclease RAMP protein Cas6 [Thiolinea sp.]